MAVVAVVEIAVVVAVVEIAVVVAVVTVVEIAVVVAVARWVVKDSVRISKKTLLTDSSKVVACGF